MPDELTHVEPISTLTLSLIENAYDSFKESLTKVGAASGTPNSWKYAVLYIVHSAELMTISHARQ